MGDSDDSATEPGDGDTDSTEVDDRDDTGSGTATPTESTGQTAGWTTPGDASVPVAADPGPVPPGPQDHPPGPTDPAYAAYPTSGAPFTPAPPSNSGPRTGLIVLVVVICVATLAGLGALSLLVGRTSDETIRARGGEVANAEAFLNNLEENMDRAWAMDAGSSADVASDGNISCWYSYPDDGDEPNDFVRCGPVMFTDSEAGTHWLRVPVTFRGGDEDVRVGTGDPATRRTWALDEEERLVRPDGRSAPGDPDVSRPPAEVAEPGQTGGLHPSDLMLDLEHPSGDSRLIGTGYSFDIGGWATTDRAALEGEQLGQVRILEAAPGEEWLIVDMADSSDLGAEDPSGNNLPLGEIQLDLAITADGTTLPLEYDLYLGPPELLLASIPVDAEDVTLTVDDGALEQAWSFTDGELASDAPEVLYREPGTRTATVPDDLSLPYAARHLLAIPGEDFGEFGSLPGYDESEPFGANELEISIDEIRLDYAVPTLLPFDGSPPDFHTASGPDRALVHAVGMSATWGGFMHSGYTFNPEDIALTLEDGTTIEPTLLGDAETLDPLFDSAVTWDVPADIESATITLSPRPGNDEFDLFELDFQGGTLEIPVDFSP